MILYRPDASVVTLRACSISAGLAASTVTPGTTPPDESVTVPPIDPLCAHAIVVITDQHMPANAATRAIFITTMLCAPKHRERSPKGFALFGSAQHGCDED